MIFFILQVFYALFSGLLLSLAIPNNLYTFGNPVIGFISLIPFYKAIYNAKNFRQAFILTALQVLTVHLASCWWLGNFRGFGIYALGASALGTALEGGLCGIFFLLPFIKKENSISNENSFKQDHTLMIKKSLWFSACYVAWEYVKSTGILGFPWGTLFMTSYSFKIFTQIAAVTGVWGITFLTALVNALIAEGLNLFTQRLNYKNYSSNIIQYKALCKLTLFSFAISLLYGTFTYFFVQKPVKHVKTVIVQQNQDPWETDESDTIKASMQLTDKAFLELEEKEEEADLVLWSEGVLAHKFPGGEAFYEDYPAKKSLSSYIREKATPFIMGGDTLIDRKNRISSNSAIFYDAKGKYSGFYSKIQLVPFAEYIPHSDFPLIRYIMNDIVKYGADGWEPGFQYVTFKIPLKSERFTETPLYIEAEKYAKIELDKNGNSNSSVTERYRKNKKENPDSFLNFSTPICFEDSFTKVCHNLYKNGSEVFMNITNDSWSKTPVAEYQHFVIASYLAIEYRIPLVRCCNSGYSAVVLPNGKIMADMEPFTSDVITVDVPVYKRKATIFSVYGDYFAKICVFIILMTLALKITGLKIKKDSLKKLLSLKVKIQIVNNFENTCEDEKVCENENISEDETKESKKDSLSKETEKDKNIKAKTSSSKRKTGVKKEESATSKVKKEASSSKSKKESTEKTSAEKAKAKKTSSKKSLSEKSLEDKKTSSKKTGSLKTEKKPVKKEKTEKVKSKKE